MKKNVFVISLLCVFAGSAMTFANSSDSKMKQSNSKEMKGSDQSAMVLPTGFVMVEEQFALDMKEIPLAMLDEAITDFGNKNFGETAGDLKSAARLMRSSEKDGLTSQAKSEMNETAKVADQLAADIRSGSVKTIESFKSRIAQVAFHKAAYNRLRAEKEWKDRQLVRAGHDLEASAAALEKSADWSGKKVADSNNSIKEARNVAAKLQNGSGWTNAEVTAAISKLETLASKTERNLMPDSARASDNPESF